MDPIGNKLFHSNPVGAFVAKYKTLPLLGWGLLFHCYVNLVEDVRSLFQSTNHYVIVTRF